MRKLSLSTALVSSVALASGAANADSNLFQGTSFYSMANQYTKNGCCGDLKFSISGNGMGPNGNTILSNYPRTVVIYLMPAQSGYYTLNVAVSDYLGAFNAYQDGYNPTWGNRFIAQTDPIPWLGLGNKQILEVYWDMQWRWASFGINDVTIPTHIVYNTGPNASFQVDYAQAVEWNFGSDSGMMLLYRWFVQNSFLGCCGQPQASDLMIMHLWDWGYNGGYWDYGPGIYTFNQAGAPGTVTNSFPFNWYGWSGAFTYGNEDNGGQWYGTNCCVTFEDLTLE